MNSKKVLKNSLIYTFSNLLLKVFSFFLLPLYTAYLTTSDYGTVDLVKTFTGSMSFVVVLCLYQAIIRFYADVKDDLKATKELFGTVLTFTFISGLFWLGFISIFRVWFGKLFFKGVDFYPTVLLGLLSMNFMCLYNVYQQILKAQENARKSAYTSILYFFLNLIFSVWLVVYKKLGANGVLIAMLLSGIICDFYMIYDLKKRNLFCFGINYKLLKMLLLYSIPLLPHSLSTSIAQLISKIFINNAYSLSTLGIFSIASQFGKISDMVLNSFSTAFEPMFYSEMNNGNQSSRDKLVMLSQILVWIYGFIFIGISLFAQEVIIVFLNANYWKAWTVVPILVAGFSVKIIYYFYINILFYHKGATKFIFPATVLSSFINIILSSWLIPIYGMYGSAIADFIAMIVRVAIIVYISCKVEDIGFSLIDFIRKIILIIAISFIGNIFGYTKYMFNLSLVNFSFKVIVYFIYTYIVLLHLKKNNIDAKRYIKSLYELKFKSK